MKWKTSGIISRSQLIWNDCTYFNTSKNCRTTYGCLMIPNNIKKTRTCVCWNLKQLFFDIVCQLKIKRQWTLINYTVKYFSLKYIYIYLYNWLLIIRQAHISFMHVSQKFIFVSFQGERYFVMLLYLLDCWYKIYIS